MHIAEIFRTQNPAVSFEFFPTKTEEAANRLFRTIDEHFRPLRPSFINVTYGAGGTTRERTRDLVLHLHRAMDITIIPHLTCVGDTRDGIGTILQTYVDAGIENVLALRGDPPNKGEAFEPAPGGFQYASELVEFIKREFPALGIGVAGYPEGHLETPNQLQDLKNLKCKVDAGADVVISQLFFDNRDFYDFAERCALEGITVPISAGIMPIRTISGIQRMAGMSGARLSAPLLRSLKRANDDPDAIKNVGAHWATEQCRDLIDHQVSGVHLFTLNTSAATRRIYESLGIKTTEALHSP